MDADIGNLRVGQAPQGIKPPPMSPPAAVTPPPPLPQTPVSVAPPAIPVRPSAPAPAPVTAPVIVAPAPSGGGFGKKALFIVLGIIILAVIAYAIASMMSGPGSEPVATATPSPSATSTPTVKTLQDLFRTRSSSIRLADFPVATDGMASYRSTLQTYTPAAKSVQNLTVSDARKPGDILARLDPFWADTASASSVAMTALGADYAFMVYGQEEIFDASGMRIANAPVEPRIIVVFEVVDATAMTRAMSSWEQGDTVVDNLRYPFDFDASVNPAPAFAEGVYRGVPVRYVNFLYADRSIDWAFVAGSNGKNYLVISSSRESAFFAIDRLVRN